jgi:O-antigen ligase/tetratricopeptide (TPR) repeat protein
MSTPTSARPSRAWQWLQVIVLSANLVWTTLCLGGFLAQTMVVTSALTALLLLVHGLGWFWPAGPEFGLASSDPEGRIDSGACASGWMFIPFLVYAAANVLWVTPVRWLGWIDWFAWAQMTAVFWVVLRGLPCRAAQKTVFGVLVGLGVVAVLLACYQRFVAPDWLMLGRKQVAQYAGRVSGPFGIPNSLAAFLILLCPTTGVLAARRTASAAMRVFWGWVTLVLLLGIGLTISRGGWLALAAAVTVWPLVGSGASLRRRAGRTMLIGTAILLIGVGIYAASPRVQDRALHLMHDAGERSRPILWRAAIHIFREHPALGSGAGSYNVLFEKYRPEGFLNEPIWTHNDYLNTLSDYGLVGFGLFFGAAAVVGWQCWRAGRRREPNRPGGIAMTRTGAPFDRGACRPAGRDAFDDRLVRQALAIGMLGFALQLFVDFHFKIPALAMAFAVVAGLYAGRTPVSPVSIASRLRPWRRYALGTAFVGAAVAIAATIVPLYRGEALREAARRRVDRLSDVASDTARFRDELTQAKSELDRAVAWAPSDAKVWADRAYVSAQWSLIEPDHRVPLGVAAEEDASRAIALAPQMAECWVRRGVARDLQGKWADAGDDFIRAISLSPKAVLPWFHYAFHLNLRPNARGLAEALVAFCLRLDPLNRDAQRLRQQLATGRTGP